MTSEYDTWVPPHEWVNNPLRYGKVVAGKFLYGHQFGLLKEEGNCMNTDAYILGRVLAQKNPAGVGDVSDVSAFLLAEGHTPTEEAQKDFRAGWAAGGGFVPLAALE